MLGYTTLLLLLQGFKICVLIFSLKLNCLMCFMWIYPNSNESGAMRYKTVQNWYLTVRGVSYCDATGCCLFNQIIFHRSMKVKFYDNR